MNNNSKQNKVNIRSNLAVIFGIILFSILTPEQSHAQKPYIRLCLDAIELEKKGNLDEAVNKYTEAINLKPDEWTGYYYRAKVNQKKGKPDEAIQDVTRAISLSPQTLSLYALRAECYTAKGSYDQAITDYNKALSKIDKDDKDIYLTFLNRGKTYFYNKQYREALNDFNESLSLAQKYQRPVAEIYYFRGRANLELNNFSDAVKDFDTQLSSQPDNLQGLLMQGIACIKTGNKEKAIANAQKIILLDPTKEVMFSGNNMSDMFNLDLRKSKSIQLLDDAKTYIQEQYSIPSRTLANIKLEEAFRNLDSAWLFTPGLTREDLDLRDTIKENLFVVYPLMKPKPEISEVARKYAVQARSATQGKNYKEALQLWSTAINIAPYFSTAYYNRALLHEQMGNFRKSITDIEYYLKLEPDASDARTAKDKIYELQGKLKNAPETVQQYPAGQINELVGTTYTPTRYVFSLAFGGGGGIQVAKNPSIAELWQQSIAGVSGIDHKYPGLHGLFSGDIEMQIKPVQSIGIGAFGSFTGGIGTKAKVSGTKYLLNMASGQFGGFARYYFYLAEIKDYPDYYIQYAMGKNTLTGYYGVATMDGIIFDYSYMKHFEGSAPLNSFGIGMSGKVGKHGYLDLNLNYLISEFDELTYEITINKANPGEVGTTGSLTVPSGAVTANFNGFIMKFRFGICF